MRKLTCDEAFMESAAILQGNTTSKLSIHFRVFCYDNGTTSGVNSAVPPFFYFIFIQSINVEINPGTNYDTWSAQALQSLVSWEEIFLESSSTNKVAVNFCVD